MPSESAHAAAGDAPLAIVSGSSSGIGLAVAERLLRDGWRVLGLARRAGPLRHVSFEHLAVDLASAVDTDRALRALATRTDGADSPAAVVHAAGVMRAATLGALNPQDSETMWQLHVGAAIQLANTLLPRMAATGHGRLVLIGSRTGAGMPGRSQYAASKAALVALARSWAGEVVASGVTVNVVSPAATDTAMLADPARTDTAPKLPPIGRLIRPDEVASLVAYLLGDAAAAITGQELLICGGASLPR